MDKWIKKDVHNDEFNENNSKTVDANEYLNAKFDSFLNKTIILSSKQYYRDYMNLTKNESIVLDDYKFLDYLNFDNIVEDIEIIENRVQLENALQILTDIEKSVIKLLFNDGLSQLEVAKILKLYLKTVSKIKCRAIIKLKKYFKGGNL